ncbi:MAG TPA: hypothetical protein PLV57_04455 [Phycisphaerae bacterium]|nr:hypothetical protein [Phycisphaerae bacterium]HOM51023.1 hypothetical protein [Phycisphaerae bacterium]HPP25748.1 hypothetical protein [Phycisphaerae bacterium]
MPKGSLISLISVLLFSAAGVSLAADLPQVGQPVDLAEFARPLDKADGIGVEWDMLHDVHEVHLTGADAAVAPSLRVEWWGSVWPANGSGGWKRLDDPWNGQWVPLPAEPQIEDGKVVFKCPPLSKEEWERALDKDKYDGKRIPTYRKTLKLRVVTIDGKPAPAGVRIAAYGKSTWNRGAFNIEYRHTDSNPAAMRIEVIHGRIAKIVSMPAPRNVTVHATGWQAAKAAGQTSGVVVDVFYTENNDRDSNDMTRVTVRLGSDVAATGFSFVPQDVLADDAMRLPSLGVLVCEASRRITLANDKGPSGEHWNKPVRLRLTERPEMTRSMAMEGMPRLQPAQWVPLGVPSARQEFFVSPGGDWSIWGMSLAVKNGRDHPRLVFRHKFDNRLADKFFAILDTREQPKFDEGWREGCVRYLEEGHLPIIHVEWNTGPVHYHHALGTTILLGDYGDDVTRRGDETVVLLTKLEVTNVADTPQPAVVHLRFSHHAPISLRDNGTIAIDADDPAKVPAGMTALRGQISVGAPTGGGAAGWSIVPGNDPSCSAVLKWSQTLQPGETRTIYFKAPFVDLLDATEIERFNTISYESEMPVVLDYWRQRFAKGMIIDVPDSAVMDFYRANLWHNIITTDRDPDTGLYNQGVGTVRYRVFANETVMIARSMDMRGEHEEARRFLEPMLHYQGHEPLKGRYSTQEGVFHSAGEYTHGEYAMNHGFVLWGVADHYLMTRDRAYLDRTAPQLIKGCDFLINERKSTMIDVASPGNAGKRRPPYYGLGPASSLEDVVEYQYWYATNAYFYLGMKRVAQALSDINHPEAARLTAEAEKYRQDIEAAVREGATLAAAVRLRDGNYVPYVPSRVWHWRHLTEGWIREALYPAIHLATAEVVSPDDPLMTWMLDELEDNIFFSWQSGFNIEDFQTKWFEKGAVTLQPCLVDTPTIYMARNEIKAALRSFWNTYALSIFPDTQCFTEWARRLGDPGGPLYKTSDESRWVMWLRQLLVWEDGNHLWFGRAMPSEWLLNGKTVRIANAATIFGRADLTIRSQVDNGRIEATVTIPVRNAPAETWLRLRHPYGYVPAKVWVNHRPLPPESIVGQDIRLEPPADGKPLHIVAEYPHPKPGTEWRAEAGGF